jgi:hypothetical protein
LQQNFTVRQLRACPKNKLNIKEDKKSERYFEEMKVLVLCGRTYPLNRSQLMGESFKLLYAVVWSLAAVFSVSSSR